MKFTTAVTCLALASSVMAIVPAQPRATAAAMQKRQATPDLSALSGILANGGGASYASSILPQITGIASSIYSQASASPGNAELQSASKQLSSAIDTLSSVGASAGGGGAAASSSAAPGGSSGSSSATKPNAAAGGTNHAAAAVAGVVAVAVAAAFAL